MTRRALVALLMLFLIAGCSNPQPATQPTVVPSASASPTPSAACQLASGEDRLTLAALEWSLVVGTKGTSDEGENVKDLADAVNGLHEEIKNTACFDASEAASSVAALNFDMSLLALPFSVQPSGRPKNADYEAVEKDGNDLMKVMGASAKFVSLSCEPADIGTTAECSAAGGASVTPSATETTPATYKPHKSDFVITLKILKKKCFGSAGCNVTYRIKPLFVGDQELPDTGVIEVTYRVTGGDSGPQDNTFTVEGGQVSYDKEEDLSTASSGTKLKVKVTDVSYDG